MIVVDTSVWIDFFRGNPTPERFHLRRLIDDGVTLVVGDVILIEVLQGVADDRQAARVEARLRQCRLAAMLGGARAIRAATHYRTLRGLGRTVRKLPDLVIATWCIDHRVPLLHRDRDYDAMRDHLGLAVVAV